MAEWYKVRYYLGTVKLKYGRMSNTIYELSVHAHNHDEAKLLSLMQISNRHGRSAKPTIISIKDDS